MFFINSSSMACRERYVVYRKAEASFYAVESHATSYAATHAKVVLNDHEIRNGRPAIYDVYDKGATN